MGSLRALPSVDSLLRTARMEALIARHGRSFVTDVIRRELAAVRLEMAARETPVSDESLIDRLVRQIGMESSPSLRRVFNLTGTILHTNLGRAPLPEEAIEAVIAAARDPSNVEFDLETGKRGDRDQ